jgi:hypothetical protein
MKNYSLKVCEDLIEKYVNVFGGTVDVIHEGTLGLGTTLLHSAPGKKVILIKEVFINSWSSGHKIRMYNVMPKKYAKIINY